MNRIRLLAPARILKQFRSAAKLAFPREHCAFLIGHDNPGVSVREMSIAELWTPEDVKKHARCDRMHFQGSWFTEAATHAGEAGLDVVGAIHSHPYTFADIQACGHAGDCAESEEDGLYFGWNKISGICLVAERIPGKLSTRIRFWGPRARIELIDKTRRRTLEIG